MNVSPDAEPAVIIGAYILLIFSDGGLGINYWRFCLPAFSIGSAGAMIAYFASRSVVEVQLRDATDDQYKLYQSLSS